MNSLFAEAIKHHQAGQLAKAEEVYGKVLESNPDDPRVFCNLGSLFDQQGRLVEAVENYRKALDIVDFAEAHYNLGNTLIKLGKDEESVFSFKHAIKLKPDYQEATNNLGITLNSIIARQLKEGKLYEAEKTCKELLEIAPEDLGVYINLGNIYSDMDMLEEAEACYRQSLSIGISLEAYNNLGKIYDSHGKYNDAIILYHKALEIDPKNFEVYYNIGRSYYVQEKYDESFTAFKNAVAIKPDYAEAYNSMGYLHQDQGNLDEAITFIEKALQIKPDFAMAHDSLSQVLFLRGRYKEGWDEYEWRWKRENQSAIKPVFKQPEWDGSDLGNKSLLIWSEQGVGDEIRFASMIPDLIALKTTLVLESDPHLVPLFARSFPEVKCIPKSDTPYNETDFQIPVGSLGRIFRSNQDSFPENLSYLKADSDRTKEFREQYKKDEELIVGISWKSSAPISDQISFKDWEDILKVPGVRFVNLQYGDCEHELEMAKKDFGIEIYNDVCIDPLKDFDGNAAQVAATDLVITIGNVVMHMAGGLGTPVWVLTSSQPSWHYFRVGERSLWHPTKRLFLPSRPDKGKEAAVRIAEELESFVKSHAEG